MKVVINKCHGGFGLSNEALAAWAKLKGRECYFYEGGLGRNEYILVGVDSKDKGLFACAFDSLIPVDMNTDSKEFNEWYSEHQIGGWSLDREDPDLVSVVEELGDAASGRYSHLAVVEIPDGVAYTIEEYDGLEHIAETHRTWG